MKVGIALLWLSFVIAFVYGWVSNIIDVVNLALASAPITALFVVKAIGIFVAPLGAILGLFF
jgi:hypothetical protein